jgi:phosphoribosylformylglycinamidine cyclo-ligase
MRPKPGRTPHPGYFKAETDRMPVVMPSAYKHAGVDEDRASAATAALVTVLKSISLERPNRAILPSGHYANVLEIGDIGVAVSIDGVGSKAIVAEELGRFDTIGVDCVAMNVNDVVCVGAEPIAVLDYISVQDPDPVMLEAIGKGLRKGAEDAGVEIPGGEVAQLPEMLRGHPDNGFDLVGACLGVVRLDRIVTGSAIRPGDVIVGLPSNGVHANGLTLARKVLSRLDESLPNGQTVGEALLAPTSIYVRAVRALLEANVDVHGLAHITSGSFRNLLRLSDAVGYRLDALSRLPEHPIFGLIEERGDDVSRGDMFRTFNMGCGFCCIVPPDEVSLTLKLLSSRHRGVAVIGSVTPDRGRVELVEAGLVGTVDEPFGPLQTAG